MGKFVNFLLYLIAPLLVLVGCLDLLFKVVEVAEEKLSFEYVHWDFSATIYTALSVLGLVAGVLWWFREQKSKRSDNLHLWSERFIRIWIAFIIAGYGFAKVLKTQFQVPEFVKDMPIGELHPFYLTWYYFGFSREYTLILAAVEIVGGVLVLFRATRLVGALVLFPAMLNIVFINLYYHISPDALMSASYLTLGALYLLLLDFNKIKELFPQIDRSDLRLNSFGIAKWGVRVLVMFAAFGLISMYANDKPTEESNLYGVWSVDTIEKNSEDPIVPNKRDSVLTKIYFEKKSGQTILEFNHRYRKQFMAFDLSAEKDSIKMDLGQSSLVMSMRQLDSGKVELRGLLEKDTLRIVTSKIR